MSGQELDRLARKLQETDTIWTVGIESGQVEPMRTDDYLEKARQGKMAGLLAYFDEVKAYKKAARIVACKERTRCANN